MKKIFVLLLILIFALCPVAAFADGEENVTVIDGAGILTSEEIASITERAADIKEEFGINPFVFILDYNPGAGSYRPQSALASAAKNWLTEFQIRTDTLEEPAVLLAVTVKDRDWHLEYTDTDDKLPDSKTMSEYFLEDLGNDDYYGGIMGFLEGIESELSFPWLLNIVIAVAIGLIMGFIVVTSMKGKLNTVRFAQNAHNYVRDGSFNLEKSRDLYLYSTITRVAKPKNNSGSGGGGGSSRSGGGKF